MPLMMIRWVQRKGAGTGGAVALSDACGGGGGGAESPQGCIRYSRVSGGADKSWIPILLLRRAGIERMVSARVFITHMVSLSLLLDLLRPKNVKTMQ